MQVVIVGAGGHGKVVLDILRAQGRYRPAGFIDADLSLAGSSIAGLPVFGPVNVLPKLRQLRIDYAIIAIGENRTRVQHAGMLREEGFELVNAIHPTASVSATARLGVNVVIAPQAAVCTDCRIDDSVIVNTGAIVDHECEVGEAAHICPGARLAGRVRVGAGAFVGIGASVIQCLLVGENATIGAGAAVIADVPAHSTVVGVPGRIIRRGTADNINRYSMLASQ